MHVLVIPSSYPTAGNLLAGIFYREQAQALHKRGMQIGVAYPDHRSLSGQGWRDLSHPFRIRVTDDAGLTTYVSTFPAVPKAPRVRAEVWLRQLTRLLKRYVADQGVPDVVHAHGLLWAGVGAVRATWPRSVPVVVTAHSSSFAEGLVRTWQSSSITASLYGADSVLAVSGALKEQLVRWAPEVTIEVVPNMVDVEFFALVERLEKEEFTWLAVATTLTKNKGIDLLLRAFAHGFRGRRAVRLRVVGEGPEGRRLGELAGYLDIAGQVTFVGRVGRDEMRSEMQQADAFVLASQRETFGVVLIEAMSTGLPVVATQSGGPDEIVYPDVGRLVAVDDPRALAEAMVGVHEDRSEWRRRATEIRSYVEDNYSEPVVAALIESTYRRAIKNRRV